MAITVKHLKVSTIPDDVDTSLVRPSDWNDDHAITGTVPIVNGGTGQATANDGFNALAPSQTGNTGKYLTTDGTDSSWAANPLGTVTSVAATVPSVLSIAGSPITTSGTLAITYSGTALPVANGGTSATTLTGYVYGNGSSAMTASATIPNTDITGLGTASTKDAGLALGVATLDAGGKVPVSELPAAVLGALSYQGTWNASTNTPTLASSVGTKGDYYVVSVAGSTNLDGITNWLVGDWAVFNGSVWEKIDNTDLVTSVNGFIGAVVLTTTDVAEGTNLYYTDTRARNSISAGTGISYVSGTGVITNSLPDQVVALTGAGTTTVTGTYPNFTITSADSTTGTVTSVAATAGTGISVTGSPITTSGTLNITNTAPDQTVSLTAGTGISTTGTYPNFTITNTSPSSGGTVTSVTGTSPVVSSGGNTPAISMPAATTSVNGYLTSTDWTTFNNKSNTNGTVTSVAAITLGTTGTDLSSTVATSTTTPVITLQVPTASAANRGALSAADWTTFNGKAAAFTYTSTYIPYGQGTTTPNQNANFTFDGTTQTAPVQRASNGIITNSKTISASYTIPATDNAVSTGPVTVSSGQSVTVSSGSRWVVL